MKPLLASLLLPLGLAACGGEPVPQTGACAAFVSCTTARDAARGVSTDVARFDLGGACWTSQEGADLCTTSCEQGLTFLQDAYVDLPGECTP